MSKEAAGQGSAASPEVVKMLVNVRGSDTVYGDVYLRRARELLATVLSPAQYGASRGIQGDIDAAVKQIGVAMASQDWGRVESLAARVGELRQSAQEKAALSALGAAVYDSDDVGIDPFSPGFEFLLGVDRDLAATRDALVANLKALASADPALASFYESRRAFFGGLHLTSRGAATAPGSPSSSAEIGQRASAEVQRLALEAAQRGDMSQLRVCAQALSARQVKAASAAAGDSAYRCPVDLAAPFSDEVVKRARTLGLAAARAEPPPQGAPLYDYLTTCFWQLNVSDPETTREGIMRAEALVDKSGLPPEVSGPVKDLVEQLLQNRFINSGGARHIPPFSAEAVLVEDFPETQEAPATGELLSALGLTRRRALARREIEGALLQHGATVLHERLLLDPIEFRLVCIPHDLYMAVGRDRGWGQQQQWTHFDGFQVLRNGHLRALAGGSARYGGLSDLVSIAVDDQREGVIARFAVIRRARQVARWR
jgi:hypothetical protein